MTPKTFSTPWGQSDSAGTTIATGIMAFAKYLHVVEKVTYRLYQLRKEIES